MSVGDLSAVPPPGVDLLEVVPLGGPVHASVRPPGSKSITNRALMVAGLASGVSVLRGALDADDTAAMVDCLGRAGVGVRWDRDQAEIIVEGVGGELPAVAGLVELDARLSGTTARFMTAFAALGQGSYRLDGQAPLRERPMGDGLRAVATLGATVVGDGEHLPVTISGGPVTGGALAVAGGTSSQFLSGLAMAGACMAQGLSASTGGGLVSAPYVAMTVDVMKAFGCAATFDYTTGVLDVPAGGYHATQFVVEADASAASYFMAIAAITGGVVRIEGVGRRSTQGDVRFADVLETMGARVTWGDDWVEVGGPPSGTSLRGVTVDLADLSDTAPTLAAVAVFADGPTRVRGVGFIRHKETDRIASVVTELRRLGIDADENEDGFVVHPGTPTPAAVRTYDDHRMAMAFTVIGLGSPGVTICDPGCVAKTFPGFFTMVESLRASTTADG